MTKSDQYNPSKVDGELNLLRTDQVKKKKLKKEEKKRKKATAVVFTRFILKMANQVTPHIGKLKTHTLLAVNTVYNITYEELFLLFKWRRHYLIRNMWCIWAC